MASTIPATPSIYLAVILLVNKFSGRFRFNVSLPFFCARLFRTNHDLCRVTEFYETRTRKSLSWILCLWVAHTKRPVLRFEGGFFRSSVGILHFNVLRQSFESGDISFTLATSPRRNQRANKFWPLSRKGNQKKTFFASPLLRNQKEILSVLVISPWGFW